MRGICKIPAQTNIFQRRSRRKVLDPYRIKHYDALHEDTYKGSKRRICCYRLHSR